MKTNTSQPVFAARLLESESNVSSIRSGTSIVEMIAALGLLSAVMGITLPFFARLATVRQDVSDRELAVHELRNLAELAQTMESTDQLTLSKEVSSHLEDPQLQISQGEADELKLKKTQLALTWINQSGQRTQPIELSFWTTGERSK